jgi:hypothetical protein
MASARCSRWMKAGYRRGRSLRTCWPARGWTAPHCRQGPHRGPYGVSRPFWAPGQQELTAEQREDILSGRTATGGELSVKQYHERMDTSRTRIGYVDLTFSAPKSVSVAWAFAPTNAERAIIHQAHHDAIGSVMQGSRQE